MSNKKIYGLKQNKIWKWPSRTNLNTLAAFLDEAKPTIIDVGARGGSIKEMIPFAPFIHYVAVEPEKKARIELETKLKSEALWRQITIVPEALGSIKGKNTLFVTQQPGLSSLLVPNPTVNQQYPSAEAFKIVAKQEIDLLPLDDASKKYDFSHACFLKLDTQGTELDIIKSAQQLIEKSVLGISIEVSFQEFYKNQPLFSDVDKHICNLGFRIFNLERALSRRINYNKEFFSRRELIWAHALYMKQPEEILRSFQQGKNYDKQVSGDIVNHEIHLAREMKTKMSQLLFLALAFDYLDLAEEIIQTVMKTNIVTQENGKLLQSDLEKYERKRTYKLRSKMAKGRKEPFKAIFKDRKYRYKLI